MQAVSNTAYSRDVHCILFTAPVHELLFHLLAFCKTNFAGGKQLKLFTYQIRKIYG